MSWAVNFIGKPEKVAEALEKRSDSFSGNNRVGYDLAKPHLIALVKQNTDADSILRVVACGEWFDQVDGRPGFRICSASVESVPSEPV